MVTWIPMAMVLRRVRMGLCFRFSRTSLLIKLSVGYDDALGQRSEFAHLAAREAGIAEHAIQLREGVGVAGARGSEHYQREHGVGGRRAAVVIGDELARYPAPTIGKRWATFP